MRLRDNAQKLNKTEPFNETIHKRILTIKKVVGLSNEVFYKFLNAKPEDFLKKKKPLKPHQLLQFCNAVDLNIENLFNGNIDYFTLAQQYHGDKLAIPEKYQNPQHKLARVRAVKSVFEYLHEFYGFDYARRILGRLQIHPVFLQNPTAMISPDVITDFLNELKRNGFQAEQFMFTGTMTAEVNAKTELGLILSKQESPKALYETLHQNLIHHFDKLFNYKLLSLSENGCSMQITPKEEALELFKHSQIGHKPVCLYKQGTYMSFIRHIQKRFAKITESECMYENSDKCVYHLSWN